MAYSNTHVQQNGELQQGMEPTDESQKQLDQAKRAWTALADERKARRRARDYYWGEQWQDKMTDEKGETVTEEEYIKSKGRIPWRMNHIKPSVRNLKGQLRENKSDRQAFAINEQNDESAEMMTKTLRQIRRINRMHTLEADNFQEHLIAGKSCFRIGYTHQHQIDRSEVMVQQVSPDRLFYNPDLSDRRLHDLRLIGQIHDLTIDEVISSFTPEDRQRAEKVEEIYSEESRRDYRYGMMGWDQHDSLSFYRSQQPGMCRVIEIWCKKSEWVQLAHDPETGQVGRVKLSDAELERENEMRRRQGMQPIEVDNRYEDIWYGYFLSPQGHVLWEGETPYAHQEHPYVLGFADFLDGESKGLVHDLIDQQRLYNRMISVMDATMSTSARGTLLIPEEMIPDGMSPQDFADEYNKVNGVVVYQAKPEGASGIDPRFKPEKVHSRAVPASAFQWLGSMKKDIEHVSGVTGPVMGQDTKSGTPAALYQQQVIQGNTTNRDFFETYLETLHDVDYKALQVAIQYYPDRRPVRGDEGQTMAFDKDAAKNIKFDVSLADVADTATYRQLFEQDLKEMREMGDITFRQYLEMSSHPRAHALLQLIDRSNPLLEGGPEDVPQSVQGALQEMGDPEQILDSDPQQMQAAIQQAAEQGDPDAMALLNQLQ